MAHNGDAGGFFSLGRTRVDVLPAGRPPASPLPAGPISNRDARAPAPRRPDRTGKPVPVNPYR